MIYFNKEDLRLINNAYLAAEEYERELKIFNKTNNRRKVDGIVFHSKKEDHGETYIVIIGESLRREHLELYGYSRNTNPNLSKEKDLLIFDNTYSNDILTIKALSLALTEANQYNGKNYYNSLSIVNLLNKAGFETFWLTNQPLYGFFSNLVAIIAKETDHLVTLNNNLDSGIFHNNNLGGSELDRTQKFDGVLIKKVEEVINQKANKNRVIFVHLMGNHFNFCSRYPKEFKYFKEELPKEFSGCPSPRRLNCYDDSVRYNDFVVSSLLDIIKVKSGKRGFLYFSDHGEDVCGAGRNPSLVNKHMLNIPFLAWFSEEYQNFYPKRYTTFKRNRSKIFSNDLIFDTLVGLFNIQTKRYNKTFDLSSKAFDLTEEKALVMGGKKKYIDIKESK